MTINSIATREEWLQKAAHEMRARFAATAQVHIPAFRVSVGFPAGTRGAKSSAIGQCWPPSSVSDGTSAVFISPVLIDDVDVLATLAHEMVHAMHPGAGHKGAFRATATAFGLTGKMTATVAGDDLRLYLTELAATLGTYAALHAEVDPGKNKKQGTRMLKAVCAVNACDAGIRLTRTQYASRGWYHECNNGQTYQLVLA